MTHKNHRLQGIILLVVLAVVFFISPLQASILNAVKGVITDKDAGTPLEGVKITLVEGATVYECFSDKEGKFYKSGLKNGMHQVTFEKEGYTPLMTTVQLRISDTRDLTCQMKKLKAEVAAKPNLIKKAIELINAGNFTGADAALTEALQEQPDNPLLYFYRGFVKEKNTKTDDALKDYYKAIELDPELVIALAEVGRIMARKGNYEEGAKYYQKAYEFGTTDMVALYNYGACLSGLGKNDEAMKVYNKMLELDPNYADAYYQLGIVYLGLGDNAKAKECLQKFLQMDPNNSNAATAQEIIKSI